MKLTFVGLAAGLAIMSVAMAAKATTVTETYNFTLNDMTDVFSNNPAPTSPVTGSFTVKFDPLLTYNSDTTDIVKNSLNVTVDSAIGFSYFYNGNPNSPQFMSIGGLANGPGLIAGDTNDFVLQLEFANVGSVGSPTLPLCGGGFSCGNAPGSFVASGYTIASSQSAWLAQNGANGTGGGVVTSGAPEPTSWALLLLGVGIVGAGLRVARRNRLPSSAIAA